MPLSGLEPNKNLETLLFQEQLHKKTMEIGMKLFLHITRKRKKFIGKFLPKVPRFFVCLFVFQLVYMVNYRP